MTLFNTTTVFTLLTRMICTTTLILTFLGAKPAFTEPVEYNLDTGDVLQIALLERPSVDGAYSIGIDGMVSVPGIGTIGATGETLRSFEQNLQALAAETIVSPSLSVQILEYRPFFILGDVEEAGKHPYVPGLTVMEAVAIAGGFGQRRLEGVDPLARSLANLRAQQALDQNLIELAAMYVRRARYKAEQAEAEQFEFNAAIPAILEDVSLAETIDEEKQLFLTRIAAYRENVILSKRTLEARQKETTSYLERIESQTSYLENVAAELAETRDLRAQGLVSASRLTDLVRNEISTRGEVLQTRSLMRQSQASQSESEQELADIISGQQIELAQNIQALTEEIARLEARIDGEISILSETGGGRVTGKGDPGHRYELYRQNELVDDDVIFTTALRPGDTVFVIRLRISDKID